MKTFEFLSVYDMTVTIDFVKWNGKSGDEVHAFVFSYSEAAEAENTVSVVCDCEGMKHSHTEIHSHSAGFIWK